MVERNGTITVYEGNWNTLIFNPNNTQNALLSEKSVMHTSLKVFL